jgi:hypothetical protein
MSGRINKNSLTSEEILNSPEARLCGRLRRLR